MGLFWEELTAIQQPDGEAFWFQLLLFYLLAIPMLYFGFRMRMRLVTYWCFRCCWAELTLSQGLFRPGRDRAGGHKNLGETQSEPGQLIPAGWRDILYHMVPQSVYKVRELAGGCSPQFRTGCTLVSRWWATDCTSLILYIYFHYNYFSLSCLNLSPWESPFSNSLPIPHMCVWEQTTV